MTYPEAATSNDAETVAVIQCPSYLYSGFLAEKSGASRIRARKEPDLDRFCGELVPLPTFVWVGIEG